ncbi:MAG: tlde1 domain-containing protein [Pseudomonadota bacterium]
MTYGADDAGAAEGSRGFVRKACPAIAVGLAALTLGAVAGVCYAPSDSDTTATSEPVTLVSTRWATDEEMAASNASGTTIAPKSRTAGHPYVALYFDPATAPGARPATFSQNAPAPQFPLSTPLQDRLAAATKPATYKLASLQKPDGDDNAESLLPLPESPQMALNVPMPRPRPAVPAQATGPSRDEVMEQARAAKLASMTPDKRTLLEKIFGLPQQSGPSLAYAAPDGGVLGDGQSATPGRLPLADRQTAVYDITAKTVYMPDGTKLEAHSGLGSRLDDPRFVHERMRGATPPAIYDLKLRESLFHGVQAIRLTPLNSDVHGRTGLLAHTYMLGPNGDSNGCVSFRNYDAFLRAFNRGDIKRLLVVEKVT